MVSALTSTRIIASQMALQILMASPDDSASQDGNASSPGSGDISSLPSSSQASLTSILNGMASSQTDTSSPASSTLASTDITTDSFMALLKQNLTATAKKNDDGGQAQAMLDALNDGTLTVNDPINGVSITAWDPSAANDSPDTATATAGKTGTTIPNTDWNDYLKTHLQRGSNGTFTRATDGSFIDKTTGNEAYFGQVGSQFYYLTWPAPGKGGSGAGTGTGAGAGAVSGVAAGKGTDV
jgi:hypothetical protein